MIRVLLVDDHAIMRSGFRMILEASGEVTVVGEAGTGTEAVTLAAQLRPDVICMDVQMPDMDGIEATRRIVSNDDLTSAVLVVTTFDRDDYIFEALQAGASGFLLKNAGPEELVSAVRVLASGEALLAPEVTKRVISRFAGSAGGLAGAAGSSNAPHSGNRDNSGNFAPESPLLRGSALVSEHSQPRASESASPAQLPELTDREREVLHLLAQAHSNAEIAKALFIGEATVKTHVSNVLAKIGARDRVAAVVFAHRHGLA